MTTGKQASPDSLLTYVNFPPTEYLDLDCYDVCSFNVYLHAEADLRAYLARLQHVAGAKPFLLAEAGADSLREGLGGQAGITAMHVRAAFEEGACGAVAFAWTDEWWRGGHTVDDWRFGLVDKARQPKPALAAVSRTFAEAPFTPDARGRWPKVSVVVCAYNAADTIDECLASLTALTYPDVDLIVVNDGSKDSTGAIARRYPEARVIDIPNGGLSAARNVGLAHATGDIVAYTDADVRVDPDWLTYLVQPILSARMSARADRMSCRRTTTGWRSAWRGRRADRRTCCSTIASRNTCRAATWRSAARRSSRSAASTPPTCAPATMLTSAGGCRRVDCGSGSRLRHWSGITIAPRCRPTGGSRSATAKARPGSTRTIPRSSCAARCCGAATSTARCRSCGR